MPSRITTSFHSLTNVLTESLSSGGVVICEMLNILEGYPLKDLGFRSAQAVHYQIEAMRHAYVDRNSYLGDPDFVKVPLTGLLHIHLSMSANQTNEVIKLLTLITLITTPVLIGASLACTANAIAMSVSARAVPATVRSTVMGLERSVIRRG